MDNDVVGVQFFGVYNYIVIFLKGQFLLVKGFWFLIFYNSKYFFSFNELNCYLLGIKNKNLKFNDDGFLMLYVSKNWFLEDKFNNWLFVLDGIFLLYI